MTLCVYCASRSGKHPEFAQAARQVGQWMARHGVNLVYGGGKTGLMGHVADAVLAGGGTVTGIIPQALVDREQANSACTQLLVVDSMHERKQLMAQYADAFLALPGGIGTFEEFFEAWTWRQLGYHDKPVGLLNVAGYYNGLIAFLQQSVDASLMSDQQMRLLQCDSQPDALLARLTQRPQT